MPVKAADELPELAGGATHHAGSCCGCRLPRIRTHLPRSPFQSPVPMTPDGLTPLPGFPVKTSTGHFKSSATGGARRNSRFPAELNNYRLETHSDRGVLSTGR